MVEYAGLDPNQTLAKGNYILSFEYDPAQFVSSVAMDYASKVASGQSFSVVFNNFEDLFNQKVADVVQKIVQEFKNTHVIVNNYSINTSIFEMADGQKILIPRVINFDITVTENPIPFIALALLAIGVLMIVFPEPMKVAIKNAGEGLGAGIGSLMEGVGSGLTFGFMPILIFAGLGFLAYKYLGK